MGNFAKNVEYVNGVWRIPFGDLVSILRTAPEHSYQQIKNDTKGYAKSSFVLDISDKKFSRLI